jgi:hypothetical protein
VGRIYIYEYVRDKKIRTDKITYSEGRKTNQAGPRRERQRHDSCPKFPK